MDSDSDSKAVENNNNNTAEGNGAETHSGRGKMQDDLEKTIGGDSYSDLKEGLVKVAYSLRDINVENTAQNQFIVRLVKVMQELASFGYYHLYDRSSRQILPNLPPIRELLTPLLRVLDGRTDFCAAGDGVNVQEARFETSDKTIVRVHA
jgi:hypothetical protein